MNILFIVEVIYVRCFEFDFQCLWEEKTTPKVVGQWRESDGRWGQQNRGPTGSGEERED